MQFCIGFSPASVISYTCHFKWPHISWSVAIPHVLSHVSLSISHEASPCLLEGQPLLPAPWIQGTNLQGRRKGCHYLSQGPGICCLPPACVSAWALRPCAVWFFPFSFQSFSNCLTTMYHKAATVLSSQDTVVN